MIIKINHDKIVIATKNSNGKVNDTEIDKIKNNNNVNKNIITFTKNNYKEKSTN